MAADGPAAVGTAQARLARPALDAARSANGTQGGPVNVPRWAVQWMTFELAEALAKLSQQQVTAIFRIVQAGHLVDDPVAPYSLIRGAPGGPPPICSEAVWKKAGKQRADGSWERRPGWSHQDEFLAALRLAKRLARQQMAAQALGGVTKGVGLLQMGMPKAALRLLELSMGQRLTEEGQPQMDAKGDPMLIDVEHRNQIAASKIVIDVALAQAAAAEERAQQSDPTAQAWWDAAEE